MNVLFYYIRRLDIKLSLSVFLIAVLGLLALSSMGEYDGYFFLKRQALWVAAGIVSMVAVSLVDYRIWRSTSFLVLSFYLFNIVLLFFLLILAPRIRGVTAWFRIGGIGFGPVEFVKIALAILLAKYFSKRHVDLYRLRHLFISGLYVAIPGILVLLQPDFGSVIVFIGIWAIVIFLAGIRMREFFILCVSGLIIASVLWVFVLQDYQRARVLNYFHPEDDPLGRGYQVIQSRVAIGAGGLWGRGLGQGSQIQHRFLPEAKTDFIFAGIAEEWGLVGVLFLFSLCLIMFWRMMHIALAAHNNFARLYIGGFAAILFLHIIIHAGMNLGLFPITGIPFPFLSYGGSSMLAYFIALGIAQNIHIHNRIHVSTDEVLMSEEHGG